MERDHELAPRSRGLRFAESEKTVQPGELMIIDAKGRVLAKRERQAIGRKWGLVIGGAIGIAIVASGGALLVPALLSYLVALGGFALWRHRAIVPFARAQSRLLEGDLDGAEALLARAPRPSRGMGARLRAQVEGWLAYGRGRNDVAIARFTRAMELTPPRKIFYLTYQVGLADALARSGDTARAKQVRGEMTVPSQPSPLVEVSLAGVDLAIAFVERSATSFDDELLHRWVRLALEINNTQTTIALLAWVFATRGDADMADHLVREAVDRFSWCPLDSWPALHEWLAARRPTAADD
jgi:hypothetical protein